MSDETTPTTAVPDGTPPTGTPPAATTETQIQAALERALSRTVAPAFQALRNEVAAGRTAAPTSPPPPSPTTTPTPDDYTALVQDPRSFVRKVAMEDVASQMGPSMLQLIHQTRNALVREEARAIDAEYGTGFFDSELREKLELAMKEIPPDRQADPDIINATVSALMGMAYRDPAKLADLTARRTATEQARKSPPMLGNGRSVSPRGDKNRASPEETEFVARLARAGVDISVNEYVKDRETPGTLAAWQARLAAEKGKQA